MKARWLGAAMLGAAFCALAALSPGARGFPVNGYQTILPDGSELDEEALDQPTELFHSEAAGGKKSYLVDLGDMAFNSPYIFGGPARKAGLNCGACHVNGASNAKLYVPGMSTRPGNFDTTGPFFNPKADDGVLDPVTIPSLRGARYLAPYGHDGRIASLRDFVRNVIVNEFAGAEPSPAILDAIVAYIDDIDFLPNPRLGPGGRLTAKASDAERRGQALFVKPFPNDPSLSCAACHRPSGAFVDHRQHDVGSGGLFKTPTLINADFNAPYFHDGRYGSFAEVVAHFDRVYALDLSPSDRRDLVAYLEAVGDGTDPATPDGVDPRLKEIRDFSSVLATAIPARDADIVALTCESVGNELRDMVEHFPGPLDPSVSGGEAQRAAARAGLKELVLQLRKTERDASAGQFDEAAADYKAYAGGLSEIDQPLKAAESWSLFNPAVHDAHYAALRQMVETANKTAR